jgi:effector-binding domain-containing protein
MITGPKLENRTEQHYMGIRTKAAISELSSVIPQLHDEVHRWLDAQGLAPSGAPFIRYHVINMAENLDIELGWPVARTLTGNERVKAGILPAGRYGTVLYTGDYSGLMEANRVLVDWAKAEGIVWDRWDDEHGDAFRSRYEVYITDPGNEPDPAKWETEVAIKLADGQSR